jgi:hypothetical protein
VTVPGAAIQPTSSGRGSRIAGGLLLIPAVAVGVWQVLVPAIQTVRTSLFTVDFSGRRGGGEFRGLEAYVEPGGRWLAAGTSLIGLGAFVVTGAIGLVVGVLAAHASQPTRLAVRALVGVMTVLYAPIGIGLALRAQIPGLSGVQLLFWVLCVALLPIGSALVALAVMAAARPDGKAGTGRRMAAVLLVLALGLGTTLALGLQMLGVPGIVVGSVGTLGGLIYRSTFELLDIAQGAAISTVMLVPLSLLGVVVTILLLALRFRVELAPGLPRRFATYGPSRGVRGVVPGIAALVGTVLTLVIFFVVSRSWVAGLAAPVPDTLSTADVLRITANTWLPPAIAVAIQLLVGVLAGFGIGGLRPLGRYSEWLLLLFAPGLFIGLTPLLTTTFLGLIDERLAEASLVPPVFLNVAAVFVFTYVAGGLRRAWTTDRRYPVWIVLSGLSTVVLVGVVSWVVLAQTVTWSLLVAQDPDRASGPLMLFQLAQLSLGRELPQQIATPVPLLVVLGAVAAAATVGMDRLLVRLGQNGDSR